MAALTSSAVAMRVCAGAKPSCRALKSVKTVKAASHRRGALVVSAVSYRNNLPGIFSSPPFSRAGGPLPATPNLPQRRLRHGSDGPRNASQHSCCYYSHFYLSAPYTLDDRGLL
jgi:hypothetical protein